MASREEIFSKVKSIISEKLGVDESQVTEEAKLIDDLGADSLDLVDLVMDFESEFGVKVDDADLEKISTVGDIVSYIEKKLG
ncbi:MULTISPECIES: acyl carrier protein [Thermotoga]|uniref:Acyl carrier protein n=4 Tax=Thermotoga TaxID=2335 RepID=ACP_THEMA|nr:MULTISPECIES: acyl carrier protein [Thermotoga]Q9WZD0.1 RecName: Full=Acyl carrier protein; Short=ACP [Thermotoga maritima MSB8]6LVT_A Chain A, Acyl carrier protein [Thermotoga maritima MSB8]6LVU_A Chain A, Acyl carrier protein [Thermotoga maritima MSB8]6LVU_B Chain B, Acyl carrier protein [Thermotoga maritima MSB8]KUK23334.1 MAG: Acyl carrier protein [Thermotoga petrophila]KUK33435.1 MAG: Acyl carrier protein [Thermotoga sp. 47_83]MBZ4661981.1 acpP [Thermotoga sp.]AAD35746.1 acyl carrie